MCYLVRSLDCLKCKIPVNAARDTGAVAVPGDIRLQLGLQCSQISAKTTRRTPDSCGIRCIKSPEDAFPGHTDEVKFYFGARTSSFSTH